MPDEFLTFQKFTESGIASEIAELLKANNIDYQVLDTNKIFDPSFANNSFDPDIILKIKPADFIKANAVLDDYYKPLVNNIDKDYYLFEFTDEELLDIISMSDQWGHFDYQLAQKILKDRGKEVNPERTNQLREQRTKDLSKPEAAHWRLVYLGYFFAVVSIYSVFSVLPAYILGWLLAFFKKTLPDGTRVFVYRKEERNHGKIMLLMAAIVLIVWLFRWFKFLYER
jgi:hypothetical protein